MIAVKELLKKREQFLEGDVLKFVQKLDQLFDTFGEDVLKYDGIIIEHNTIKKFTNKTNKENFNPIFKSKIVDHLEKHGYESCWSEKGLSIIWFDNSENRNGLTDITFEDFQRCESKNCQKWESYYETVTLELERYHELVDIEKALMESKISISYDNRYMTYHTKDEIIKDLLAKLETQTTTISKLEADVLKYVNERDSYVKEIQKIKESKNPTNFRLSDKEWIKPKNC